MKYAFSYDANGRMLTKGTQQAYVYDALNRMTQVTNKETYLYDDAHGRRVQVNKTSDNKKNYPIYSLDGKLLVEDNRQTLIRAEYIYAGGRLVAKIIQPITSDGANSGTATTTYIHTDFLGSPVAETDSAGVVTRVERYTPYGEPSDMQLDVGPGFTGHATDVLTGLTYMQQRYYDAEIGRFISPDPVGPEEDFVNHFNRYNYAQNNPVRYTDPDGRFVNFFVGAAIGAGIEVAAQVFVEGKSLSQLNGKNIAIAAGVGAITGGVGGRLAASAATRTISVGEAVAGTAATGGAANGVGSVVGDVANGESVSVTKAVVATGVGAITAGVGAKLVLSPTSQLSKMADAKVNAPQGIGNHVAEQTNKMNTGKAAVVAGTSSSGQQAATAIDAAGGAAQKKIEK